MFPSRDQMVGYLERYAARERLEIRCGITVQRIDRDEGGWVLRTSNGEFAPTR